MPKRPEIVVGFVGPIGVRMRDLIDEVSGYLRVFTYHPIEIDVPKLLSRFKEFSNPIRKEEYDQILHNQKMAYFFRKECKTSDASTLAAIVAIREERSLLTGSPDQPANGTAYLLSDLSRPEDVQLFRRIYGSSFYLIAAHATKSARLKDLADRFRNDSDPHERGKAEEKANNLVQRDEEASSRSDNTYEQDTRNTFPLADVFIDLEPATTVPQLKGLSEVRRFIDLLFGHPFHSPKQDEVAMYLASASALRSSDERRQVGAVIAEVRRDDTGNPTNIDIVATGMNEVPMRGGGFYWDGAMYSPDARDQWLIANRENGDRALDIKKNVLTELIDILKEMKWFKKRIELDQTPILLRKLLPGRLKGTQFMNIGEFQRQVHAEMAALIDGARRGVSVDGLAMYVTTFPCHNCAKHIIAAGIKQVVYLEPYPKSRATELHEEEIALEPKDVGEEHEIPRVLFSAYTGVAPRQYQRIFSMAKRGKKHGLALKDWNAKIASLNPQYLDRNASASYLITEREELERLPIKKFREC